MNLALSALRKAIQLPARLDEALERRRKLEGCVVGQRARLHPESRLWNFQGDKQAIAIGTLSHIRGELLVFAHGGVIRIGEASYVGEGTRIWSAASVTIGSRVLISHGVNIHDTTSHSLSAASRHDQFMKIIASGHPTNR